MSTARNVLKNTVVLLLGRVFSIAFGVVYVAALARYIHAEGMGKIATAMSLVSMVIIIAHFGLSQVIVRDVASDKSKAYIYVPNAILLRLLLSGLFGVVIISIASIAKYPRDTTLIIYIYGFAYIFDELTDVAFSIFNAFEKMEYSAVIQAGRDMVNIVLSLGAIYLHASLITIVLISAVASLLKLGAGLTVLGWRFVKPRLHIDRSLYRRLFVAALPFATLGIITLTNQQIDTVLLSFYRPAEEVGWFSAAHTLIGYLLFLPGMFLQAIFPVFSRFHTSSKNALRQAYRTSFKYLLLLGFPLCVGTIVTADYVTALVYGPGFENASLALRIQAFLLLWMFGFANGALLSATGGQTFLATILGAGAALNVVVAFVLIPQFGFVGASIAAIISGAVFFFPITLVCHSRLEIRFPYGLAFKSLISSLIMGIIVASSLRTQVNLFVAVFVIAPTAYCLLLTALHAVDHEDMLLVMRLFKRREVPLTKEISSDK